MQSSNILMIKAAVMNGLGVGVDIPFAHCHEELKRGELVPILNGWHRPSLGASVVCSQAAWHIRRVRVFIDNAQGNLRLQSREELRKNTIWSVNLSMCENS